MAKVHILSPEIISKIAASEVIERPASVIKELLENSLDAGAESIELTLKDGGKTLIHLKDNGHGIASDDLKNIFHRHATSKISTAEDLFNIMSMGFRGEALYSVAAIGDIILRSRIKDDDSGWEVHMRGGTQLDHRPCALSSPGTDIQVKELFFNTPVRKKFLKSNTAEMHQSLNTFIPYTLAYPQCRFKLTHQDRKILDLAPAELSNRFADTLNLDHTHILDTTESFDRSNITIRMVLGDINIKRRRRDMQFIFVNNRPIQSKNISYHLNQIYRLIMPPENAPVFAVFINLPPEDIDVNIHPAKREVKIANEHALCGYLRTMCEQALMQSSLGKQVQTDPFRGLNESPVEQARKFTHTYDKGSATPPQDTIFEQPTSKAQTTHYSTEDYAYPRSSSPSHPGPAASSPEPYIPEDSLFTQKQDNLQNRLGQARYIGGFIKKYQLFESENALFLIDQHAAQERITYEQLIQQMDKGGVETQALLTPELIKMSVQDMLVWEEAKDQLAATGFETTQWDDQTVAVHSHPQLVRDIEKAVRHLLAGENIAKCDHDIIARRACRSSIMTGDKLNEQQAVYQRDRLIQCSDPFTCPHGRPTVIEMSEDFLDKQFLRT